MIHVEFTEDLLKEINHDRKHHPHHKVRQKMEVLWQKHVGIPHYQICQIVGISGNTLRAYLREYQDGGLDKIREIRFYQPQSKLAEYKTSLTTYFRRHPPASAPEAARKIEQLTGIQISPKRALEFLKTLGFKRRKVGHIPAKADPDKQEAFRKDELEPRLKDAKAGTRAVFFVDAAHFVMAPFLGFVWCLTRLFIQAPAGRKRFNVLGALNAVTHELITVVNDSYINSHSVADLLHKLAALRLNIPITLVLDNARYQKCTYIKELAASLHIELLYLPAYSPNLNLIERLWKFVKAEVLNGRYYEDFSAFKAAITGCLAQTGTTYKHKLDSLLNPKFQTFKHVQTLTR
jgi:transposase